MIIYSCHDVEAYKREIGNHLLNEVEYVALFDA